MTDEPVQSGLLSGPYRWTPRSMHVSEGPGAALASADRPACVRTCGATRSGT